MAIGEAPGCPRSARSIESLARRAHHVSVGEQRRRPIRLRLAGAGCTACLVGAVLTGCTSNSGGSAGDPGGGTASTASSYLPPSSSYPPPSGSAGSGDSPTGYAPLVDSAALACPSIDFEVPESDPSRWRLCSSRQGTGATLINISDDVEVFGAPSSVSVRIQRHDASAAGLALAQQLKQLADSVSAGQQSDPAVPAQGQFAYLLPGDKMFVGSAGIAANQLTASTSRFATAYAAVSRALYALAEIRAEDGSAGQSFGELLLQLQNPVAQCAQFAYAEARSEPDLTLTGTYQDVLRGARGCKKAISLFSVSRDEAALQRDTESVLAFRFRMVGRHALQQKNFWEDAAKVLAFGGH